MPFFYNFLRFEIFIFKMFFRTNIFGDFLKLLIMQDFSIFCQLIRKGGICGCSITSFNAKFESHGFSSLKNPCNLGISCTSIIATIRCGSLPLRFLWFSYLVLVFAILRWYHQFRWKSILAIAIGLRLVNSIQHTAPW